MANEIEYGIKIFYKVGISDTKWFASERLRDRALPFEKAADKVKKAKPVQRKKK
jgi:hypothetical protein